MSNPFAGEKRVCLHATGPWCSTHNSPMASAQSSRCIEAVRADAGFSTVSSETVTPVRGADGYPDCPKCWGNGVVLGTAPEEAGVTPCEACNGTGCGPYEHAITADVRLGEVLAGLRLASLAARNAVKQASPPTVMRQPLDGEEHEGHWLTRKQVYDACQAASAIERILRELTARVESQSGGPDLTSGKGPDHG